MVVALFFKISLQLQQALNRLEEEGNEKKEALRQRVERERRKLKATMRFSRAAALAALAHEVKHNIGQRDEPGKTGGLTP